MSEEVWIALITTIPVVIAALGTIIIALYRAHTKLNHITILTNSTHTAAVKRIEDLENIIKEFVKDKHEENKKE